MKRREKVILIAVASLIGVVVLYGMLNAMLLGPKAKYEEEIASRTKKLHDLRSGEDQDLVYRRKFAALLDRAYTGASDREGLATQHAARQRLLQLADQSELDTQTLSFLPSKPGPEDSKGQFREIGWTVKVRGDLTKVTDFLYRLDQQPYLQRIENVKVRPDLAAGEVDVTFRYLTLALMPKGKSKTTTSTQPTTQPASQPAPIDMDTPHRRQYDAIASRDLFRPYLKKPAVVAPPPPREPGERPKPTPQPTPSTDQHYRVVGLPNWSEDPRKATILLTDTRSSKTVEHTLGAKVGGGEIVWVDYRPMPSPNQPEILSTSRMILKIKDQYWAVELGHTLAQKHALNDGQLPGELQSPQEQASTDRPEEGSSSVVQPLPPAAVPGPDRSTDRRVSPSPQELPAQVRVRELAAATTGTMAVDER